MADPVKQFQIKPIIELENVAGLNLSFTNSSLWMALGVILSASALTLAMQRKALVPGRVQVMAEMLYEFIAGMIRDNIGSHGRRYFTLVFTIFMFVFMGNLLGMLPFSFTYTSHIIVTATLALMVFLLVFAIGVARHGLEFFSIFVPPGTPLWLTPMVVPIEFLSFIVRPVTLSVRLFANMMAGHLVLKVFAGFSVMMAGLGAAGFLGALLPMAFNVLLIAFEFLIAYLQAYVFAVLSCIYLKDTIEIHH